MSDETSDHDVVQFGEADEKTHVLTADTEEAQHQTRDSSQAEPGLPVPDVVVVSGDQAASELAEPRNATTLASTSDLKVEDVDEAFETAEEPATKDGGPHRTAVDNANADVQIGVETDLLPLPQRKSSVATPLQVKGNDLPADPVKPSKRKSVAADFWGFKQQEDTSRRASVASFNSEDEFISFAGARMSSDFFEADESDESQPQDMRFRCWDWLNSTSQFKSVACSGVERWAAVLTKGDEGIKVRSLHNDQEEKVFILVDGSVRTEADVKPGTDECLICGALATSPDDRKLALGCVDSDGTARLVILKLRWEGNTDGLKPRVDWISSKQGDQSDSMARKIWWGQDEASGREVIVCCGKSSTTVWTKGEGAGYVAQKTWSIDDTRMIEDLTESKTRPSTSRPHSILEVAGSMQCNVLALAVGEAGAARKDSTVRLLSLDSAHQGSLLSQREYQHTVISLWMSKDGSRLAVGGGDRRVTVLDISKDLEQPAAPGTFGETLFVFDCKHSITTLWGPADGHWLGCSSGHDVLMWSLDNGIKLHEFALSGVIKGFSGSESGHVVAACSGHELQVRNFGSKDMEVTHMSFAELSHPMDSDILESCPALFCSLLKGGPGHLHSLRSVLPQNFTAVFGAPSATAVAVAGPERAVKVLEAGRTQANHRRASLGGAQGLGTPSFGVKLSFRNEADVNVMWMTPDLQLLACGCSDVVTLWDVDSEAQEPKTSIEVPGLEVHALWGTEDGTYLAYLVTEKQSQKQHKLMRADTGLHDAGSRLHAKLHVHHLGFEAAWGSTIEVEDVELVDEVDGGRVLNWQGLVSIDGKLMAVREKTSKVTVRSIESVTLSVKHDLDHLPDRVNGVTLWGPPERKLLALVQESEIRVLALETEALLHVIPVSNIWAVWSSVDGQALSVCTANGVAEWNLERLFEVGPSFSLVDDFARQRHLPDAHVQARICSYLALFADRHAFLARDASFLKLLLDRGFVDAMQRFLSAVPAAVRSPLRTQDGAVEKASLLEVALEFGPEEHPEAGLDIMLKAMLGAMEHDALPIGCMQVVSSFIEAALDKERHEKVERVVFEFLSAVKLVDLQLEHLPHSSERVCIMNEHLSPYSAEDAEQHGLLGRLTSFLRKSVVALEAGREVTIWSDADDDVYSDEATAFVVPLPLPEQRAVQRALITNPISFQSEVVACVVEGLWNDKFRAWFRWQAFVFLILTVTYTWFCLTCATLTEADSKTELKAVVGNAMGIISVVLNTFFLAYEALQFSFKYQQLVAKASENESASVSIKAAALVSTLREHYDSLWNVLATLCFALVPLSFVCFMVEADTVLIRSTSAVGILFIWLYLLYFARGWDQFAILVAMLVEILRDMLSFMLVMVILVVAHASSFTVIHSGKQDQGAGEFETFSIALQSTVHMSFLGAWTTEELELAESKELSLLSMFFFYVIQFFIVLVSLNALIGIMGTTQGRILDEADDMIQRQRVSIILDIMDIEDYVSKMSIGRCFRRSSKVSSSDVSTPFRERRWVHVLQPKSKDADSEEAGHHMRGELAVRDGGGDEGPGDNEDQLKDFAEKIPNIEMLLSKVIQGTEKLNPVLNLAKKSWVLNSQLDSAHSEHDKVSMDLLTDLATKAHAEKVRLQSELQRQEEATHALQVAKAELETKEAMLAGRVTELEGAAERERAERAELQTAMTTVEEQLRATKEELAARGDELAAREEELLKAKEPRENAEGERAAEDDAGKLQKIDESTTSLQQQMKSVLLLLRDQAGVDSKRLAMLEEAAQAPRQGSAERPKVSAKVERERQKTQAMIDSSPYSLAVSFPRRASSTSSSGPVRSSRDRSPIRTQSTNMAPAPLDAQPQQQPSPTGDPQSTPARRLRPASPEVPDVTARPPDSS